MDEIKLEKMLHLMREAAPKLAKAKSERVYLEQFRKSKKALLYQQAPEGTIAERESYAYAHPDYIALLEALRDAVATEEELRWRMVTAQLQVEIWRTQRADRRREVNNYGAG